MAEYRRKKFYIDKIFQSKFLFLFLLLCFFGSAANVIYLSVSLKKAVESNLYRHRIVITNVNEIIANHVVSFNAVLLAVIALLAIVFYFLVRKRIKYFLDRLDSSLSVRKESSPFNSLDCDLPEEFEDINDLFSDFFKAVDRRLEADREVIASLKKFVDSPDDKAKQEVMERLVQRYI